MKQVDRHIVATTWMTNGLYLGNIHHLYPTSYFT